MKIGDIIKYNNHQSEHVYAKDNGYSYRREYLDGRIIKEIKDDYFLLKGDYSIWFKISDFEGVNDFVSEPSYEIY